MKSNRMARRGISGIVGALILFVMLFTVGTTYFLWVNQNNSNYEQAVAARNNANIALAGENVSLVATEPGGHLWFSAQNGGVLPTNLTSLFVITSGSVVCQGTLKQGVS